LWRREAVKDDDVTYREDNADSNCNECNPAIDIVPTLGAAKTRPGKKPIALLVVSVARTAHWAVVAFFRIALNACTSIVQEATFVIETSVNLDMLSDSVSSYLWVDPRLRLPPEHAILATKKF